MQGTGQLGWAALSITACNFMKEYALLSLSRSVSISEHINITENKIQLYNTS